MFENKISVPCLTAYILTLTEKLKKKYQNTLCFHQPSKVTISETLFCLWLKYRNFSQTILAL